MWTLNWLMNLSTNLVYMSIDPLSSWQNYMAVKSIMYNGKHRYVTCSEALITSMCWMCLIKWTIGSDLSYGSNADNLKSDIFLAYQMFRVKVFNSYPSNFDLGPTSKRPSHRLNDIVFLIQLKSPRLGMPLIQTFSMPLFLRGPFDFRPCCCKFAFWSWF